MQLNKTKVVRAAIFDLLTSQCDRHAQNIFINERGQLTLIDNEAALQSNWATCGFDSILIPGTQVRSLLRGWCLVAGQQAKGGWKNSAGIVVVIVWMFLFMSTVDKLSESVKPAPAIGPDKLVSPCVFHACIYSLAEARNCAHQQ